jgi:glycosyltransferase involved in cell wall biosynthesis
MVTTFYGVELRWVKSTLKPLRRFIAWAARRSARVVAISSYTAAELRELVDVPVDVIPYTAALPPAAPRAAAPGRERTVLFVGRLVERKGVAHLIEALTRMRTRVPARLVVVGDGPERPKLEELARRQGAGDRVEFRGRIAPDELQRTYAAADAFVLPAVHDARGDTEGLGVVLLEAMNYGIPVIASRVGGIVDIVVDEETGLLVPPGDPGALAGALDRVLGDPDLGRRLGEGGRRRLAERFSWDAILARWETVYRTVR